METEQEYEIQAPAVSGGAMVALARAEIDQQISTARAYPRTLSVVAKRIMDMATLDDESAEECHYAIKRGGKAIKGPSIRFAEILKQAYGNCRSGARVVHVDRDEGYVEAEGIFHDLETNSSSTQRVRRRILDKSGKVFTDDMIIVTGNAACSIAIRNAILAGVPKPLWRRAYDHVMQVVSGGAMSLQERRENALGLFKVWGIDETQLCEYLEVRGVDDINTDHIVLLKGAAQAIKNGEETVESVFTGAARAAARNDRGNPFQPAQQQSKPAGSVEGSSSPSQAPSEASADTGEAPAPETASPRDPLTIADMQAYSDHLWGSKRTANDLKADCDQWKTTRWANKSASGLRDAIVSIDRIHKTRVTAADPSAADDHARAALAELGIESPEADA